MQKQWEIHEAYWQKEKLLVAQDYERNDVLPQLFRQGEHVLDVGCGDGAVAEYLKLHLNTKIVGLDISPTALVRAKTRQIPVIRGDAERLLPIRSRCVDAVFVGDVIEHLYNPQQTIKEIHRVLVPGGRIVVSCPNMGYWRYRIHYLARGIFPETEWIQTDLWQSQHIRFFNPELLKKLLKSQGFLPTLFLGISRRRLDRPFLKLYPQLFGMIMVIEAKKA